MRRWTAWSLMFGFLAALDPSSAGAEDCDGNGVTDSEEIFDSWSPETLLFHFRPVTVVASDLEGDRDPDLAATNYSSASGGLSILLNQGGRSFSEPVHIPTVGDSHAAADLDGDKDLDLAVANKKSHSVSILKNDGAGGFTD
ncbi:MAG: VCBS repeat-containing protein [Planctomycetes bacterium]|nr:VCBS repeat-containing protein [Planctomycetota bacterium]